MCFISRQAHRTVNSNSVLAWGYARPEVENDHRKNKWQAERESPLSSSFSIFLVFLHLPLFLCLIFPLVFFMIFDSLSAFSLSVSASHCLFFLSFSLFYFRLWFACKFFLALGLSRVSFCLMFSCCSLVSAAPSLFSLLPSICSRSPPRFVSVSVSATLSSCSVTPKPQPSHNSKHLWD